MTARSRRAQRSAAGSLSSTGGRPHVAPDFYPLIAVFRSALVSFCATDIGRSHHRLCAAWQRQPAAFYEHVAPLIAEALTLTIKEEAIPIISDVSGFKAYYVIYAPDDTVTAISIFENHRGAEESNRRALAWIEKSLAPLLTGPATAVAGPVIVHTLV